MVVVMLIPQQQHQRGDNLKEIQHNNNNDTLKGRGGRPVAVFITIYTPRGGVSSPADNAKLLLLLPLPWLMLMTRVVVEVER